MIIKKILRYIKVLRVKNEEPYVSLYKLLGFYPNDPQLYITALTHRSYRKQSNFSLNQCNERQEFLGDAMLSAIISDRLFLLFPEDQEGFLSKTRSKMVNREILNRIALEIKLNDYMRLSMENNTHNNDLYGNALEALVGAVYQDQGYEVCYRFVESLFRRHVNLKKLINEEGNHKSELMEWGQKRGVALTYRTKESEQLDSNGERLFESVVAIEHVDLGEGIGYSKKQSQQQAAKKALKNLRTNKDLYSEVSACFVSKKKGSN